MNVDGSGPLTRISSGDEFDYWRAALEKKWDYPINLKRMDKRRFYLEMSEHPLGELRLVNAHCGAYVGEWSGAGTNRRRSDILLFQFVRAGSIEGSQDGAGVRLHSGGATLLDSARPYSISVPDGVHLHTLVVPRSMVLGKTRGIERLINRDLQQDSELYPIVAGYVAQLAQRPSALSPAIAQRVGHNLSDLISAMVAEVVAQSPPPLSECRTAVLLRVRGYIEGHVCDPDLTPAAVGEAMGLSPRYINQLLHAEGTSLGRLIWQRRTERVAAALRDPALAARSLSVVALAHGFRNLSHFSTAFKQRFGSSPRDYRHAILHH